MSVSKKLKILLIQRGITAKDLAELAGQPRQSLYNAMNRDSMKFDTVEKYADLLGFDIVFRDRTNGKIYE